MTLTEYLWFVATISIGTGLIAAGITLYLFLATRKRRRLIKAGKISTWDAPMSDVSDDPEIKKMVWDKIEEFKRTGTGGPLL